MSAIRPKKKSFLSGGRAPRKAFRKNHEPEWVAWSNDLSKVVAKGATLEAARDAAMALGEMEPVLEPVQRRARLA